MTYGMRIWDAVGNTSYSSEDVTWNQIDVVYVPGGGSFSADYELLTGREVLVTQMMINPPPLNRRAIAHTVTVSGTSVSIYGGSEDSYGLVLMR